jgi:carboxypeptidase A
MKLKYRSKNIFISDPSAGSSMDHAYGKFGIPISYTIEMRGNGDYGNFGFFLPPEFIIPNAEEILNSFVGIIQKAREFGRFQ